MHTKAYAKFLTKFNIFHEFQFGFRNGHSMVDAFLLILHKINSTYEEGNITMNIYQDLSEAFDTVEPNFLHSKCDHYGV